MGSVLCAFLALQDKMSAMQPVVAKFRTFREAEAATREYNRRLSPAERLKILFQLRAFAHKETDAPSGRMERVYRITQLERPYAPGLQRRSART
jgi:hypothetical protein